MLPLVQGKTSRAPSEILETPGLASPAIARELEIAIERHRSGDLEKAAAIYRKILKRDPRNVEALDLFGLATLRLGHAARATQLFAKAVALAPGNAFTRLHLGDALAGAGEFEKAAEAFRTALEIEPQSLAALASLGNALKSLRQFDEAIACYRRVVEFAPHSAEAQSNLGLALKEAGKIEDALSCLRHAVALAPHHPEIQFNFGNVLLAGARFDEAEAAYADALTLNPQHARAWCNRGVALRELGRGDDAAAVLRKALDLAPEWADAHWNLGLALLMQGRFEEGWREYEWRRKISGFAMRQIPGKAWDGAALRGRTLLVHAEQGLGDAIQFARYLRVASNLGGTVKFLCPPSLLHLFSQSSLCDAVSAEAPSHFDVQAPLMSLPHLIDPKLERAASLVPYLKPDAKLVDYWGERLRAKPGFRVGISWQGNPAYRADRLRSIPLHFFLPLALVSNVRLISLQKGAVLPKDSGIGDLGPELDEKSGGFMDSEAAMHSLDLVITSDTAIAHLAGALGVETWLALAQAPDWRWGRNGETCPWYPTMRLFRQRAAGDWAAVFEHIGGELAARAGVGSR